jgi:hypothetical protein
MKWHFHQRFHIFIEAIIIHFHLFKYTVINPAGQSC